METDQSPFLVPERTTRLGRPRIEDADLQRAVRAIQFYSVGAGIKATAAVFGMSRNTLKALLRRHPELACLARCNAELVWMRKRVGG